MVTTITINVANKSNSLQNFYFFQQPSQYSSDPQVYSNSLYTAPLQPYDESGSVISFTVMLEYYAGVLQQAAPPVVGKPSGQLAASRVIDLTPAPGGPPAANTTTMSVMPSLGLSVPVSTAGPQPGAFRIVTPSYNPALATYSAGSAVQTLQGEVTLSNFVTVQPNRNLDCQPVIVFYVQIGAYSPGTVLNFTASSINAAVCDFRPGYRGYNVAYDAAGQWRTEPFNVAMMADGQRKPVSASGGSAGMIGLDEIPNAGIRDAAGPGLVPSADVRDGPGSAKQR
jgi:hypothetical protein